MIVQCEKCRTKFRIADERVSPKGVKVRCSRCAHVFVARREDEPEAGPKFTEAGPDTTRLAPSELLGLAARTHPDRADSPSGGFEAPIAPASTEQAALALGFSGAIDRVDSEVLTVQSRLPGSAPAAPPAEPPEPPSWATDETVAASLEALEADEPEDVRFPPPAADSGAHAMPPPPPPQSGDFFPPPPETHPRPFQAPPPATSHGLAALGSSPFAEPEPTGSSPALDGFGGEGTGSGGFPPPSSALNGSPFAPPGSNPLAAPLTPSPNPASSPFAAPLEVPGNSGDIPGLIPPDALSGADPFAGDDDLVDADDGPPPTPPSLAGALPTPVARIGLNQAAAVPNLSEKWSQAETTAIAAAYEEQPRPAPNVRRELPQVGDRGGLWPSLVGALLGGALVLTFLPEVGAGILDTFSRRGGDAINRVAHQKILPESLETMRPIATHVVAYRIASAADVLVVRGSARNLGSQPVRGLSAVALAMSGDRVVARASAPVGVLLDPLVLARLENPAQVSGAYAQHSGGAHEITVGPGGERPFMVVFPEMPEGATDLSFLVEFVPFDP